MFICFSIFSVTPRNILQQGIFVLVCPSCFSREPQDPYTLVEGQRFDFLVISKDRKKACCS